MAAKARRAEQRRGAQLLLPPLDQLAMLPRGMHDLGVANLFPDEDKHVRHFLPAVDPDPRKPGTSFSMQLALRAAGLNPALAEWEIAGVRLTRDPAPLAIGFAGPPGTVPAVSMNALLKPDALRDPAVQALKGRTVIVAASHAGTADRHFTPYSRGTGTELMTGGEIHANVVETILSGRYPRPVPAAAEIAYLAVLLMAAGWGFMHLGAAQSAGLAAGLCAALALPSYLLFHFHWIVPVAEPQAGILAAFLMALGLRLTGEARERARIREMFGKYVSDEVVDKYIGDAVMAVFGSPVRHPDHARRAVRAALGMAREAEAFKQWMHERFPGRGLAEFGIGVGLHSGDAVIGDIGTPKRKEFTAIGDTVNAASRLEGVTKEMDCVVAASEATVLAAGPGVQTGKVEQKTVKGKSEPLTVYEVTGLKEEYGEGRAGGYERAR